MAVRNIVKMGDPMLNKVSRPVEKFDQKLHTLLDDMAETMRIAEGCGLAAVQVGILRRVCIVDAGDGLVELINPKIVGQSGRQEECEGCLSCPNTWGVTSRPMSVIVEAYDRNGNKFRIKGEDLKARAFCHEIDHLDGVLFTQKVIRPYEGE
ncbi:MAG: peptide deformylase [Acutalibacteraceae bacterium]|nr:peptide deformylase [Clostridia bacterium]MBQ2421052.1 peptide deformylase [Clostridia bacterium]MEE1127911.1 peptide deformylase [Acutalibacteraceae bacterium]